MMREAQIITAVFCAVISSASGAESVPADQVPFWPDGAPPEVMMGQPKHFTKDTFKNSYEVATRPRTCVPTRPIVQFVIQPDGSVSDLVVIRSSGAIDIDDAMKADVLRLEFTSPTRLGKPIAVKEQFTLGLRLPLEGEKPCSINP